MHCQRGQFTFHVPNISRNGNTQFIILAHKQKNIESRHRYWGISLSSSHSTCQRWWNETADISRANRGRQTCMWHIMKLRGWLAVAEKMETDLHAKRLIIIPWLSWTVPFIYMINSWIVIRALVFCFSSIPSHLGGVAALSVIAVIPLARSLSFLIYVSTHHDSLWALGWRGSCYLIDFM